MAGRTRVLELAVLLVGGWAISPEMQQVLDKHNVYRCMHGVPLLTWDDAVAANAQAWADNGVYEHSSNEQRVINGEQCGENLAWGYPQYSGTESTVAWYDEIKYTDPCGTATSMQDSHPAGEAIGHYTQVVWRGSTKLGCGKGRSTVNANSGDFWVCQYCTAGNYAGQFEQNVNAPIKSWSECGGESTDVPANLQCQFSPGPGPAPGPAPTPVPVPTSAPLPSPGLGGSGGTVTGTLTVTGVDGDAFCRNAAALDAVEAGIADTAGLPASSVDAWCENAVGRRLEAVPPRRAQAALIIKYTIQVPPGSDPYTLAQALQSAQQQLTANINSHLQGSGFQVEVTAVTADAAGQPTLESMPAEGTLVGNAGLEEALGTLPELFTQPSTVLVQAGVTASRALTLTGLSVLVVGVAALMGARRRWGVPAPQQDAVE
jgi:hypothetical protein